MEGKKITNLQNNRTKNWTEVNYNACGTYNTNSQIKGAPSSLKQLFTTESALKVMKNALYFILKALLILNFFRFCLEFLVM